MYKNDALRVEVVKHGDKELRLNKFITASLPGCDPAGRTVLVLARSFESPVARALAAVQASGALAAFHIRAIVLEHGPLPAQRSEAIAADLLAVNAARLLKDRRFLDAHEIMVLAPSISWVGDCMRRDPSKRDAFETSSTTSIRAASNAVSCFERLWTLAAPLSNHRKPVSPPVGVEVAPTQPGDTPPLPASTETQPVVAVSSRH